MHQQQNAVETLPVTVISDRGKEKKKDLVVREYPLSIVLNGNKLLTVICPTGDQRSCDQRSLAVGHLFTQGFISGVDEIKEI